MLLSKTEKNKIQLIEIFIMWHFKHNKQRKSYILIVRVHCYIPSLSIKSRIKSI